MPCPHYSIIDQQTKNQARPNPLFSHALPPISGAPNGLLAEKGRSLFEGEVRLVVSELMIRLWCAFSESPAYGNEDGDAVGGRVDWGMCGDRSSQGAHDRPPNS